MWQQLSTGLQKGEPRAIARAISLVENGVDGYAQLMKMLPVSNTPVIGITGPPGAGKSTLVDALIAWLVKAGKKIGVLCIDPSSPFNAGALLGDRIRMSAWYNHPHVFIRSLATRGALGGLNPKTIEITDVLKAAPFDYIIIETVGVGQSEIEIAGLADCTLVVLVPEGGDDIQAMKAGLMEVADLFAVNKADRPGADLFVHHLTDMLAPGIEGKPAIPIVKTVASQQTGIEELAAAIETHLQKAGTREKKYMLLAEKAWRLIQQKRMANINKHDLMAAVKRQVEASAFNLYQFIDNY